MAGVTFDASGAATATGATTATVNITVGSGANRAIALGLILQSTGTQPASVSVSGAGATGWALAKNSLTNWQTLDGGNAETQLWVGTAPSTGAQTVTATWTNAATAVLFAATFTGVNQTTPVDSGTRNGPIGTQSTILLGTSSAPNGLPLAFCSAGEMLVDVVATDAGTLSVSGGDASQTLITTGAVGSVLGGMSRAANTGPLIALAWSSGSTGSHWHHSAATLIPLSYTPSVGTFLSACGTLVTPSQQQTGTQVVVGLGFSPRVIGFEMAAQGATEAGPWAQRGFVCQDASGTIHQLVWSMMNGDNGHNPTTDMSAVRTDACCGFADAILQQWEQLASLSSFDADGFTLNWTTNTQTFSVPIYFWAIGGSDVPNANIIQWTDATTTGNKSVTGAGFPPTFALFFDWGITAALPYLGGTGTGFGYGFGVAKDSTHRFAIGGYGQGNVATPNTAKELLTNHCHVLLTTSVSSGPTVSADLVSFDSDGFTLNYDTVATSAYKSAALVLGGSFQSFVGTATEQASTGSQSVSMVFSPNLIGVWATGQTATGFSTADAQVVIGYGASSQQRWSYWTAEVNANATIIGHNDTETNSLMNADTQVGSGATLAAQADFSSASSSGLTISWGTNDSVARILPIFALGASSGWSGPAGVIPGAPGRARVWSIFPNGR